MPNHPTEALGTRKQPCALLRVIAGRETAGYYEIRHTLPHRAGMGQKFLPITKPHLVQAHAATLQDVDVFVGCAPRTREEGVKDAIRRAWCLWVDCDTPASVERLYGFKMPPTLVTASGTAGHAHAWWELLDPLPSSWAETANRRLATHLGADVKCGNVDRILRPPGTFNHKHNPARPVSLLQERDVAYSAAELVADLPDPRSARPVSPVRPREFSTNDDLDAIDVGKYVRALSGREPDGRGMVLCPFHKGGRERTPSMKVYPETRTFHCWGCGRGGDVYEFGSMLWDMDRRTNFPALKQRLADELGVRR